MGETRRNRPLAAGPATGHIDPHRTIGEEILMLIAGLPPRPARSEGRMG